MYKIFLICLIIMLFNSCSTHYPTYKFVSYTNQDSGSRTIRIKVNDNKDVEIIVLGIWNDEYNLFIGYESWYPAIAYAKNSIQNGNLSGSWLDSCKNKIVIWKSEDKNFKNASIEIKNGPEDIFRNYQ